MSDQPEQPTQPEQSTQPKPAPVPGAHPASRDEARRINNEIRYVLYSAFKVTSDLPADRDALVHQTQAFLDSLQAEGVTVRGIYDIAGMRAEADLFVWLHSTDNRALQRAYKGLLRTPLGRHLSPFWSNMAVHRPAEFNKRHVPGFMQTDQARDYICVYPFVRSYQWYVMDGAERARLLREHGMAARDYPDVLANTLPSFALGDYEWLLCFEADQLHRIVDLMRDLRATEARLHVREEIPFFTGPRVELAEFVAELP